MANLDFELQRDGNVATFMDIIRKSPNNYKTQGLESVRSLNTDPRSTAYLYVFHHRGATIVIEDRPFLGRSNVSIYSGKQKKARTELLNIINGAAVHGVSK